MDKVKNAHYSENSDLSEDSDDDEWYFNSISRFEQLQMFNFETPANHLDLSENDHICFTGKIRNNQQEIQEFALPEKFSTSAFESHDLKLKTGGFSSKPVYQMKCLLGLRKIILSEEHSFGASIYELGNENSAFIKEVSVLKCGIEKPQIATFGGKVALGSSINNIHLADTETNSVHCLPQTPSESISEDILGLSFLDNYSIAFCESQSGRIRLFDCRSQQSKTYESLCPNQSQKDIPLVKEWIAFSVQHNGNYFGLISSQGNVAIFDSRKDCNFPLIETKLEISGSLSSRCLFQTMFSPHSSDVLSISGSDGNVSVFRIEANVIKAIFCYDGHNRFQSRKNVLVTNHIWSPVHKNLLFSSAEDGSFHCWKFIENKGI